MIKIDHNAIYKFIKKGRIVAPGDIQRAFNLSKSELDAILSQLQKIDKNYVKKLSYNQWAIVAVILSFIASILFLLFYFAEVPSRKRLYFVTSILSFLLFFVSIAITFNQFSFSEKNVNAIIFSEKTSIKNAPTLNSDTNFTVHEGTKVTILDAVDNWKKIKLADGKTGWILSEELKEI